MVADPKKPYGDVEYADPGYQPDGKKRYPLSDEAKCRAAWSYVNQAKNAAKYTAGQLAKIKAKIRAAGKKYGIEFSSVSAAAGSDLLGVELARPGTWQLTSGPREFTADMLRDAADFYAASGNQRIPLGFGHRDSRFDGEPAFGWLSNVRFTEDDEGPVLLGDLVDMDDWVAAAAPERWPQRSIEGVAGVTFQGRDYGLVLTRLALLGATPPGMPVLKSLSDVRQLVAASVAATGGEWIAASAPETSPGEGATPDMGAQDPSTSREGAMGQPDAAKLREALGLEPDASDDEVKAALASAGLVASQPEPNPAPNPTPPAPQPEPAPQPGKQPDLVAASAAQPGTIVIASSVWEQNQKAMKDLTSFVEKTKRDERDTVIAKAVVDGKFTPAQKPHFARLWDADPDGARNLILNVLTPNSALAVQASGYDGGDDDAIDREYAHLFPPKSGGRRG